MAEVIMPKMGDAMIEGKVLAWRKKAGDKVQKGEVIAEIETDKVNVEIEAESSGTLTQIVVAEGVTVPVGEVIAYINGKPRERKAAPQEKPVTERAGAAEQPATKAREEPEEAETPEAEDEQEAAGAPASTRTREKSARKDERIKASPLARRLAAEQGVDLSQVTGTGPGDRIIENDIETYLAQVRAVPARAPEPTEDYEDISVSRMRQAIARTVVLSKQTTPHFYVTAEVDMTRALELRRQLLEAYGEEEGKVSVNDMILKATAVALRRRPELNAQVVDERTVRRHRRVHLGIMVSTPDGLIAPVLRDADRLGVLDIARQARRLIEGARQKRLKQEEYTGATFSVSNLGMYDVTNFVAIINPPQAGILAAGRAQERPVVRDGQVVVRAILEVTVSADHRVTDGVGAAELVVEVKRLLENPILLLLDPDPVRAAAP
jgi:pyruvate dehydrogenase E2 component (dihydrolipoamide acetyltransferase)